MVRYLNNNGLCKIKPGHSDDLTITQVNEHSKGLSINFQRTVNGLTRIGVVLIDDGAIIVDEHIKDHSNLMHIGGQKDVVLDEVYNKYPEIKDRITKYLI